MQAPHAVAKIVEALRQAHGDAATRLMLDAGMTLETLIDALLNAPLSHGDAVRLMTTARSKRATSTSRRTSQPGRRISSSSTTRPDHFGWSIS